MHVKSYPICGSFDHASYKAFSISLLSMENHKHTQDFHLEAFGTKINHNKNMIKLAEYTDTLFVTDLELQGYLEFDICYPLREGPHWRTQRRPCLLPLPPL